MGQNCEVGFRFFVILYDFFKLDVRNICGNCLGLEFVLHKKRVSPTSKCFAGRMHQIRAHMASIARPILGDAIYGGSQKHKQIFHFKAGSKIRAVCSALQVQFLIFCWVPVHSFEDSRPLAGRISTAAAR